MGPFKPLGLSNNHRSGLSRNRWNRTFSHCSCGGCGPTPGAQTSTWHDRLSRRASSHVSIPIEPPGFGGTPLSKGWERNPIFISFFSGGVISFVGVETLELRPYFVRPESDSLTTRSNMKTERSGQVFGSGSPTVKKPKGSRVRKQVYLPRVSPYRTRAPSPPGLESDRRHGGSRARKCP